MPVYLIEKPGPRLRSPVKIQALSVSGFQPDGFISHAISPGRCPGLSCGRLSAWRIVVMIQIPEPGSEVVNRL
jgi:hypothetical protein